MEAVPNAAVAAAMALAERTSVNIKNRKNAAMGAGIVLAASFAGMVSSAYTADHIKRSGCNMDTDKTMKEAYRSAWISALISAGSIVVSGSILAALALKN